MWLTNMREQIFYWRPQLVFVGYAIGTFEGVNKIENWPIFHNSKNLFYYATFYRSSPWGPTFNTSVWSPCSQMLAAVSIILLLSFHLALSLSIIRLSYSLSLSLSSSFSIVLCLYGKQGGVSP